MSNSFGWEGMQMLGRFLITIVVSMVIISESAAQESPVTILDPGSSITLRSNSQGAQSTHIFFDKEYSFSSSTTLALDGANIEIFRYERGGVQEFGGEFAVVLVLHGNGTTQTLAVPTLYGGVVKMIEAPEPILAVSAPLGGNGWKTSPHHVLSLHKDHFLKNIGQVDWVIGNDLSNVDDAFESNPWLGHAGAPYAQTYYKVENGKLLIDEERNRSSWDKIIEQSTEEIEDAAKARTGKSDEVKLVDNLILQKILVRLLCYRLQGRLDEGLKKTQQDLIRCFGEEACEEVMSEIKVDLERRPITVGAVSI